MLFVRLAEVRLSDLISEVKESGKHATIFSIVILPSTVASRQSDH